MSINLGNDGGAACKALSMNDHFIAFKQTLYEQAQKAANTALNTSQDNQATQIGYARALRDLFQAVVSASSGVPQSKVVAPGALKNGN